ncbi:hypothetical protein BGZ60DRAFT_89822 [Tricladium varicosporioides]|nr:hypothetical protein BGZ60DRAFT_89822 [Hymenoscyphus varicosporioides]
MGSLARPEFVDKEQLTANICDVIEDLLLKENRSTYRTAILLTSLLLPSAAGVPNVEKVCWLWGSIFWFANTYHPSTPEHDLLVDLLVDITKMTAPREHKVLEDESIHGELWWRDLPRWNQAWRDFEYNAPIVPSMAERKGGLPSPPVEIHALWRSSGDTPMLGKSWTNMNALGAKLHARTRIRGLDLKGLYALMEALEEDRAPRELDDIVPAAACWILSAGKKIRENDERHTNSVAGEDLLKRSPGSRGKLYSGATGFSNERWAFWRMRFGMLSREPALNEETRLYATQAVNEMLSIEVRG